MGVKISWLAIYGSGQICRFTLHTCLQKRVFCAGHPEAAVFRRERTHTAKLFNTFFFVRPIDKWWVAVTILHGTSVNCPITL